MRNDERVIKAYLGEA
ncbi:hypothetical protein [Delftia acidovorans]